MEQNKEYYAFISYKREDVKWAKWLQDKLEHYKFPTNLNGRTDLPKNIRPTFRDVTDITPGLLAEEIDKALRDSEWLIVICSPRSAKSPWVCKEAQTFIDLGRADHIIPLVIEGIPFSKESTTECYPDALLNLTDGQELLAANINEMGRDAAAIKVIARMFNLRFDLLWQRYAREKKRRLSFIVATSIVFAVIGFITAGIFVRQNKLIDIQKSKLLEHIMRIQNDSVILSSQNDSIVSKNQLILAQRDSLSLLTNNLIHNNKLLIEERDKVRNANREMMINRSRYISQEALRLIEDGDIFKAIALLLCVIPDGEFPNRPYVPEAEKALRVAIDSIHKGGEVPIALLECGCDRAAYCESVLDFYFDEKNSVLWVQFLLSLDAGCTINSYDIRNGSLISSFTEFQDAEYQKIEEECCFGSLGAQREAEKNSCLEGGKYRIEVIGNKIKLYKRYHENKNVKYYILPEGPEMGFDNSAISSDSNYMIICGNIYNLLTGERIRTTGLPGYHDKTGIFTPDGQYVIVKNDYLISVENSSEGVILNTIDLRPLYTDICGVELNVINSTLCVKNDIETDISYVFSIPEFKEVYRGKNTNDYYNKMEYYYEYDRLNHILSILDSKTGHVERNINIDLSFIDNVYEYLKFELLEDRFLYIGGIAQMAIYDIRNNEFIRQATIAGDRYSGSMFNDSRSNYLTFTSSGLTIYDPIYGEMMSSFYPQEFNWEDIGSLFSFWCGFTKDSKYVICMCENANLDDGSWSVAVLEWYDLSRLTRYAKEIIEGRILTQEEKRMLYLE